MSNHVQYYSSRLINNDLNHSLGCLPFCINIIRLLGRVYHFSLLICYTCSSLASKKDFYSELTLQDSTDKDYEHAQKVFKECCTDVGDYHDLCVQTNTLLLVDVFEKFGEECIERYGLDSSYFYSAPGLA